MEHRLSFVFVLSAWACTHASAQTSFTVGSTTVDVVEMATGLNVPWDMVLGPDGWIWFTEIDGHISRLDPDNGTIEPIHTVAGVHETGLGGGLQSLAFHPDFEDQPYVYVHYCTSNTSTVIERFYYDAAQHTLTNGSGHLLSIPLTGGFSHNGSRIVVDDEGMFLVSIGDAMSGSALVQDLSTTNGKVLRFDPEGGIPATNPVPGSYMYNWGHRNPQGLVKASNGHIYNSAHGAGHDDEVNVILPNRNYGWPSVLGLCNTPAEMEYCSANNVVEPIHEWTAEVVAPSGIDYYGSTVVPEWTNSIFAATLRGRALHQLRLAADGLSVTGTEVYLSATYGRFRDVLCHPDGRIFVCTSNNDWAGAPQAGDDKILALVPEGMSTGIKEHTAGTLVLWPNPAQGTVLLSSDVQGAATVRLRDAAGRTVRELPVVERAFDVSTMAPGVYTVELLGANGYRVGRLLVR